MNQNKAVFSASNCGTSQDLAEKIGERLNISVSDLKTLNIDDLKNYKLIIFAVSTYGRGAPPRGYEDVWKKLQAFTGDLSNVEFAVYGAGSSSFEKTFLGFAKNIENKMKELGAKEVAKLGILDEMEDVEFDFDEWIKSINN